MAWEQNAKNPRDRRFKSGQPHHDFAVDPLLYSPKNSFINRAKYACLPLDEDVKRWYRNLARGSKVTADVSLRRLGLFCLKKDIKPRQLIELGEEKATRLILDTVDEFEAKGYANSYIKNMLVTKLFISDVLNYCYGKPMFAVDGAPWLTEAFKELGLSYNVESFR